MELVRVNATLNKEILEKVDHYAQEMQEDRSTAIRQLLARAIIEIQKQKIITAYKEKKLTIRQAAQALGVDYWQMQEFLEEQGIPITDMQGTELNERKGKIREIAKS